MKFDWELKRWTMRIPFVIAGQRYDAIDALWVTVEDEQGYRGRGETCGVDYLGESIDSIIEQLERARPAIEAGIDLDELQGLLPSGGARNGVDCALWDLKCRATGQDIWTHTGIPNGTPTATVYTIGIVEPAQAAALATQYRDYASLKIKADASGSLATIAAVRNARPDAHILIDANQSWTIKVLEQLESTLRAVFAD